jgi:hypothetical protein
MDYSNKIELLNFDQWLRKRVERETARMAKHQEGKLQADLSAYMAGYERAIEQVHGKLLEMLDGE